MAAKTQRKRSIILVGVVTGLLVLAAAITVPVVMHQQKQKALQAEAAEIHSQLANELEVAEAAAARWGETRTETDALVTEHLQKLGEALNGQESDFSTESITAFSEATTNLEVMASSEAPVVGLTEDLKPAERADAFTQQFLDADDDGRSILRRAVTAEVERLTQITVDLDQQHADLEGLLSDAETAIRGVAEAGAAAGERTLADHPEASRVSRESLEGTIASFRSWSDETWVMPAVAAENDPSEVWEEMVTAVSQYAKQAETVRATHAEAVAPPPPPVQPAPAPADPVPADPAPAPSGGGGSGGGGGGGMCTWMEWGPIAPYWTWGPCSEMP